MLARGRFIGVCHVLVGLQLQRFSVFNALTLRTFLILSQPAGSVENRCALLAAHGSIVERKQNLNVVAYLAQISSSRAQFALPDVPLE